MVAASDEAFVTSFTIERSTPMADYARLQLPANIADDLIKDGVAVKPLITRGADFSEVLSIATNAVNSGAALVSVVLAVNTFRRLARAFVRRRHDSTLVTMTMTVGTRTDSLEIDLTSPDAEDILFGFFVSTLDVAQ
jgi:hypothetical protein